MSRFLKVSITREQSSVIYVKVPDGFENNSIRQHRDEINSITEDTVYESDWMDSFIGVESVKEIPEEEFRQWSSGEIK
jgi:hypothetical protein